ncbi:MAG TPA: histidine kinase [Bacteroidales bacterium]|nr:histidine kinase [Bacteroidales bacterium]
MSKIKIKQLINPLAHIFGWLGYFFIPKLIDAFQDKPEFFRESELWWTIQILIVIFFYVNYLIFIPGLLFKKKYLLYTISTIACIIGFSFIIEFFVSYILNSPPSMSGQGDFMPPSPPGEMNGPLKGVSVFSIVFVISTALRMSIEWFKNEKLRRELENEKLKAELEALKAQIDPHFFFNVLNNICSLARKKSDDTEKFIIKLSELIRYNLYENKGEKFFLEKEIQFLKSYIEIQQLRLDKNANVKFDYDNTNQDLMIEPMILFPFIENAFKHGISYQNTSSINIKLKTEGNRLFFEIENLIAERSSSNEVKKSGIGLTNVKKRLSLLYSQKHNLNISQEGGVFKVNLTIEL